MNRAFRSLARDRRGVATIETALWVSLVCLPLVAGFDYALFTMRRLNLNSAIEQAAISAFQTRDAVDKTQIAAIVTAGYSTATVTVTCNGTTTCTNTSRPCSCPQGYSAGVPTFTAAASCSTACTDGTKAGYFMTIRGQATYRPLFALAGINPPTALDQTVTVALQ